ncbi:MAG: AIR synthase related protein, partial [Propionibacteriaceae bacterium]|nr:AIR synthase related protein [Propionibacteriaceae bacterium]
IDADSTGRDETFRGVALSCDASGVYTLLNPYHGAQLALCEAYRNVAMTGAQPIAVTDCLNFGSPEEPEVMWQFTEAIRGLVDACKVLGLPVTGGNVSFYNRTGVFNINPTPVVGVLGVIDDVRKRIKSAFARPGDLVCLVGTTHDALDGTVWAEVVHRHLGGLPPMPRLRMEKSLAKVMAESSKDGLLRSAHDLSEGGLIQAIVECCLLGGCGAELHLPGVLDVTAQLFAETPARALVSLPSTSLYEFDELCDIYGLPCVQLGVVMGNRQLVLDGVLRWSLDELYEAWKGTIPAAMGD